MPGELARGIEIVVQGNDRMPKPGANVIDHPGHAQRHPADPETRENVEDLRS